MTATANPAAPDTAPDALRLAAERMMDPQRPFAERREAALALQAALSALVGLDDGDPSPEDHEETMLPSGKAISPQDAARCVPDFMRTGAFLSGVAAAVEAARARFPGEKLRLVYAGCGPFAMLVLPLAHRWPADALGVTLIDVHARSLAAARRLAGHLGVLDRIDGFVQADAATWQAPEGQAPHLVITETMQRALAREPQVAITENLGAQIVEGGLLVPERISLNLAFLPPLPGASGQRHEAGPVIELSRDGTICHEVVWPETVAAGLHPFIRTHIRVFGAAELGDFDSGLTMPAAFDGIAGPGRAPQPGERLRFRYEPGRDPGPAWDFAADPA